MTKKHLKPHKIINQLDREERVDLSSLYGMVKTPSEQHMAKEEKELRHIKDNLPDDISVTTQSLQDQVEAGRAVAQEKIEKGNTELVSLGESVTISPGVVDSTCLHKEMENLKKTQRSGALALADEANYKALDSAYGVHVNISLDGQKPKGCAP